MMRKTEPAERTQPSRPSVPKTAAAVTALLYLSLAMSGCFDPVYPQLDRETRAVEALGAGDSRTPPPSPLGPSRAVVYALANNLDAKVAEIETAYHNESAIAARRRMLPSLTVRYSMDHGNHPSARWSQSSVSGNQSLESSFSSDPNSRHTEVGMMWSVLDFGVGYLKSRQQGERVRYSMEQARRVRQQVVLDVLSTYWRASAAVGIAAEAEALKKELDDQAGAIRDSVEMRILSGAEGARRELSVHGGLAELEQWRRAAIQSKLELARAMGCGNARDFVLEPFPPEPPPPPPLPGNDPSSLQAAALQRRPELFQQDAQERIAVDEARIALLQMAPNANLSMSLHDDPDKFLEWSNWMTVGARVSWNLLNIPARLAERRMARLQGETARQKGLALAAGIMAQVGIAYSDWKLSNDYAATLSERADARARLVEALAAGERDGQTRPGEVLQERVRLLSEKASALRAGAEARIAGARLANAIGIDVDAQGRLLWKLDGCETVDLLASQRGAAPSRQSMAEREKMAQAALPPDLAGLRVVKAEDFEAPPEYFSASRREVALQPPAHEPDPAGEAFSVAGVPAADPGMGEEPVPAAAPVPAFRPLPRPEAEGIPIDPAMAEWNAPIDWGPLEVAAGDARNLDALTAELEDMDEVWRRLAPGDFLDSPSPELSGTVAAGTDPGLARTLAPSGKVSEEIQAMSPAAHGQFRRVKNLPLTSFAGPANMKGVKAAREEIEKRKALAPLQALHSTGPAEPEIAADMVMPPAETGSQTLRPGLQPPRTAMEPGSLRPPS